MAAVSVRDYRVTANFTVKRICGANCTYRDTSVYNLVAFCHCLLEICLLLFHSLSVGMAKNNT
jgi:hypothetical protein